MVRLRALFWLAVLVTFAAPSFGVAPVAGAHAAAAQAVSADCPDHAPPPDPCPAKDTAKHAAGECCPMASSTLAVLPPTVASDAASAFEAPIARPVRSFVGHVSTKDPPPPRG